MMAFKRTVRARLLGIPAIANQLAWVAGSSPAHRAVYAVHISQVKRVHFPAVSLFFEGGSHRSVFFAEEGTLQVDVWVPDHANADDPVLAWGLTGADALYRLIQRALHRQHLTAALQANEYLLHTIEEDPRSRFEDFEEEQRLHHLGGRFHVVLSERNAELVVPT